MYSVESPFNEEDLLNNLLETLRIQEGPSKQMMESFEKAAFQKIEKEKKKSHRRSRSCKPCHLKTVLLEHAESFSI